MRPCTGIAGLCGPLCRWSDLEDGTYTLEHVLRFNYAMDELTHYHRPRESE